MGLCFLNFSAEMIKGSIPINERIITGKYIFQFPCNDLSKILFSTSRRGRTIKEQVKIKWMTNTLKSNLISVGVSIFLKFERVKLY